MERIDAFGHVLPKNFYDELMKRYPTDELRRLGERTYMWDIETRLADLDDCGIDRQVLTLARPPIWLGMDEDGMLSLVQLANDEVRRIAVEYPDRFIPTATLPIVTDDFLAEYDRCVHDLGISGVQIFSNMDGKPIDGEPCRQLFEKAEDDGVPIWIHPQLYDWVDWASNFDKKVWGWIFDTSLAMARLVFSGIMEKHPDLKLITHHMGGMTAQYAGRAKSMYEAREMYPNEYVEDLPRPVDEYFRRFYADTVLMDIRSPAPLELGHEFFGPDNLLFATDYPFGPDEGRLFLNKHVEAVEKMRIPHIDRTKIFSGNLQALLN